MRLFSGRNPADGEDGPGAGLPALGPAGTTRDDGGQNDTGSRCSDRSAHIDPATMPESHKNNTVATFVNPKFSLQYTCNICETKNRVLVSRQAYREGMVVAVCKGCNNKHWIADNLDPTLKETPNIEDYLESKGMGNTIHRVSKEIYEIERVWGLKEGVLTDDEGNPMLE